MAALQQWDCKYFIYLIKADFVIILPRESSLLKRCGPIQCTSMFEAHDLTVHLQKLRLKQVRNGWSRYHIWTFPYLQSLTTISSSAEQQMTKVVATQRWHYILRKSDFQVLLSKNQAIPSPPTRSASGSLPLIVEPFIHWNESKTSVR